MTASPQLFSGGLRPFPGIPGEWPAAKRHEAEMILDRVRSFAPDLLTVVDRDADVEDFWEDACRLSAAHFASCGSLVMKAPGTMSATWSEDEMAHRLGPVARSEEGGHHSADRLIDHPIVREHGGRGMLLGAIDSADPETDIVTWLASRHRDHGISRGVIKSIERKNGIWSIELDSNPNVVRARLLDAMDWTFVRLEGREGTLLAQDAIDLQWEYRLFVVDGELVTGAGCVEEFTPLDRDITSGAFDNRVRRIRGHLHQGEPSPVESQPEIVGQLVAFGQKLSSEYAGTIVIDVAFDAVSGAPVVVELNDLPNSGLYASDPWLVARALVVAHDRGYFCGAETEAGL